MGKNNARAHDVKITLASFYNILTGFKETLPEKYLKRERQNRGRKVAKRFLEEFDGCLKGIDEDGVEGVSDAIYDGYTIDPDSDTYIPLWILKLWGSNWDDQEAKLKVRKMRDLYKQVLEELGFINKELMNTERAGFEP